jgi:hypothetical protein
MTEQIITYQERLQATAKKHADKYNAGGRREYAGGPLLRNEPEHMMDEAEVTVAAQVEAIREVLYSIGVTQKAINKHLLKHGYIYLVGEADRP